MEKLANSEVLSFLALCDLRGVGFETLRKIARERISFTEFFSSDLGSDVQEQISINPAYSKIREHLSPSQARQSYLDEAQRKLDYLQRRGISIVFQNDAGFPRRLFDLRDVPNWLFVEGSSSALQQPSITAVGSREVSADGKWLSTYFGYCIQELGAVTVSGLAEGVDQIVHRGSLASGLPTIAVLGTGILSDYPKGSQDLRRRIVECGGTVVTEYLPNDSFSAKNFVRRNRIQAALGQIVFPIEWSVKSGTAHTVKFASDMRRPIAFVRTPTQPSFDWLPKEFSTGAGKFTLPGEHDAYIMFMKEHLSDMPVQQRLL